MSNDQTKGWRLDRRGFLKATAVAGATAAAAPHIWRPRSALASTSARGSVKHLLYVRLGGGFRFSAAFNGDAGSEFNPFGLADNVPSGTEWGVGKMLEEASWLNGDEGRERADLGMRSVNRIADRMAVIPCVDHEPTSNRADGNHGTGLERFLTGYVGGDTSILTMINYGLRARAAAAAEAGEIALPPFSLGDASMSIGHGEYAAHRPPVVQGDSFEGFGFDPSEATPDWAQQFSMHFDERVRLRQSVSNQPMVDAYIQARAATEDYSKIFRDESLAIRNNSDEPIHGLSNRQLATIFGDNRIGRRARLTVRLFGLGCPAVFFNQGYYDMHSGEEQGLPRQMDELNRLISGMYTALNAMDHPEGGSYWDHTMVVFGSEFGRTARGGRFNSARGSDHSGDFPTRWMSMPFMGGLIDQAGAAGKVFGQTDRNDLRSLDRVVSYRSVMKFMMDSLGCDHRDFFPSDAPTSLLLG